MTHRYGEVSGAVLAVHGGAGRFADFDPARAERARAGLTAALEAGLAVLRGGGPALEAVVVAVRILEDDEEFNAGRGSVLTSVGTVETDAAVADGRTGRFAGVAGVSGLRNPVDLARGLLDRGGPVLLAGAPAADLARELRLPFEPAGYFVTERRRHEAARGAGTVGTVGTVGAVALDATGDLAAATSTGGMAGKLPGRVGDTPVPGAGTWADNLTCAVSATGDGEAFLRAAFAHEVDARLRLANVGLAEACSAALARAGRHGGSGGCIALTRHGLLAMPFTTAGMLRGWTGLDGRLEIPGSPGT